MSDSKLMGIDRTLFQLQASGTDMAMSRAKANTRCEPQGTDDLEQATRQFESLLLNFMIREMRATVPESGIFPPSMAQDMFTSMLDEKYADTMADNGGIGLNKLMLDQLRDMTPKNMTDASEDPSAMNVKVGMKKGR
jgi:flagellar protein FlgJ